MILKTNRNKFKPERIKTLVINFVNDYSHIHSRHGYGSFALMNYMKWGFKGAYGYEFDAETDALYHFNRCGFYFLDLILDSDEYDKDVYENDLKLRKAALLHEAIPTIAEIIKQLKPSTIAIVSSVSSKIVPHIRVSVDLSGCDTMTYVLPGSSIWPDDFVEKFLEDRLLVVEDTGASECEKYIQHRFFDTLINGGSDLQPRDQRYGDMMVISGPDVYKKYELTSSEKFKQLQYEIYFDFAYNRKEVVHQKHKRMKLFLLYNPGEISEDEYRNKMSQLYQPYKKKNLIANWFKSRNA